MKRLALLCLLACTGCQNHPTPYELESARLDKLIKKIQIENQQQQAKIQAHLIFLAGCYYAKGAITREQVKQMTGLDLMDNNCEQEAK